MLFIFWYQNIFSEPFDLKNDDDLKNEDELKNEDNLKDEDDLKNKTISNMKTTSKIGLLQIIVLSPSSLKKLWNFFS